MSNIVGTVAKRTLQGSTDATNEILQGEITEAVALEGSLEAGDLQGEVTEVAAIEADITSEDNLQGEVAETAAVKGELHVGYARLLIENAATEGQLIEVARVDQRGKPLIWRVIDKSDSIPIATTKKLGGVIVGPNLEITEKGLLMGTPGNYTERITNSELEEMLK